MNEGLLLFALTVVVPNPDLAARDGVQPRERYELRHYTSRTACEIDAVRIRVPLKAARIVCVPFEPGPDSNQAQQAGR